MQQNPVDIPYGKRSIRLDIPVSYNFYSSPQITPLNSHNIEHNIIKSGIRDFLKQRRSVLLLIPDKSRDAALKKILPVIIPMLKGKAALILVGGGIHSAMTDDEIKIHIGKSAENIQIIFHDPDNENLLKSAGRSPLGNNIRLSKYLFEYEGVVLISSVNFHYFAGFGGGAKLIMPGCADRKSIETNHRMVLGYPDLKAGIIKGNPLQREFRFSVKGLKDKIFAIENVIHNGNILFLSCGNLRSSFSNACGFLNKNFTIRLENQSDVILASAGGYPYDINLIQAHKGLEHASYSCREGGTIIYFAECIDGTGSKQFLPWFDYFDNLNAWKGNLKNNYQINGQTALRWAQKSKKFKIYFYSSIDKKIVSRMGMIPVRNTKQIGGILKDCRNPIGIFPFSGHVLPVVKKRHLC